MNNLLRALKENEPRSILSNIDLKQLLTTVKEIRNSDIKLLDPFYESLEGLLTDLRAITMDSRDAEAFLRPVSRVDVPDYYDVITNPMDLQTMMKKVKQKQYKSKLEFQDDLELIWSNCLSYNSENHPLSGCALRMKAKSEQMLKHITDCKERQDPPALDLKTPAHGPRPKINGAGHHLRSVTPDIKPDLSRELIALPTSDSIEFGDTVALLREPYGMLEFSQLDRDLAPDMPPPNVQAVAQNGLDLEPIDEDLVQKRKLDHPDSLRPLKRARLESQTPEDDRSVVDLWWDAFRTEGMLRNGLPPTRSSSDHDPTPTAPPTLPSESRRRRPKPKRGPPPNTLLSQINTNIRTLRRVRRTHTKYATLNNQDGNIDGVAADMPDVHRIGDEVDDHINEWPWRPPRGVSGIDLGEERATDCLRWVGRKILEHAGFQGTSKAALDVLVGVTSEYLLGAGKTIRFFCDKYSREMTPEEIILHTLFESGTSKVQNLGRYIKDDIIRYGIRLGELEKKLVTAFETATMAEVLDDGDFFDHEDGEDTTLVMGNFADALGDDFLGLRELGIVSEFGLTSLTIPKKLLKAKNANADSRPAAIVKPSEPPLPYPPPRAFAPLDFSKVDDQIGLLKTFYQGRFAAAAASNYTATVPPIEHALPGQPVVGSISPLPAPIPTIPSTLPDDPPPASQVKMTPVGQINKISPTVGTTKKKNKGKESVQVDSTKGIAGSNAAAAGMKRKGSGEELPVPHGNR